MTARPARDQASSNERITHSSRTRFLIISQDIWLRSVAWNDGWCPGLPRKHGSTCRIGNSMTAPTVDLPRQARADGRFRFVRGLVAVEAGITLAEVLLVVGPA